MRKLALPLIGALAGLIVGLFARDFLPSRAPQRASVSMPMPAAAKPLLSPQQGQDLRANHYKRDMAAISIFQLVNNAEGREAAEAFLDEAGTSDSVRELLRLAERY